MVLSAKELQTNKVQLLVDVLSANPAIDAAALYGSAARGDSESHSDVDLPLLCRGVRKYPLLGAVQRALGEWFDRLSVTVYTEYELKFLNSVRSLFLLHLKREAILLTDRTGFLASLLEGFEPKKSYRSDFEKSLSLVDPLRSEVLCAPNQYHRLSYVYSLFRVFSVYLLAEMGIYEFSKAKMAQLLVTNVPNVGEKKLSNLRVLNSNFFSGGTAAQVTLTRDSSVSVKSSLKALERGCPEDAPPVVET